MKGGRAARWLQASRLFISGPVSEGDPWDVGPGEPGPLGLIWGLLLTLIVHCLQSEQPRLNREPLSGTFNCLLAC